ISITDFDFSKSFNDAIEAKQVAEQNVQKAQRDLQRIEVEAKQKIAQAGAEASALRLQRQEISPDLLKLREIENQKLAIEKWNGVLPQVTGESTPLINIAR
ncbi:MAG TPA: prohibitin family protein, partial [Nitrospirota bacterium]